MQIVHILPRTAKHIRQNFIPWKPSLPLVTGSIPSEALSFGNGRFLSFSNISTKGLPLTVTVLNTVPASVHDFLMSCWKRFEISEPASGWPIRKLPIFTQRQLTIRQKRQTLKNSLQRFKTNCILPLPGRPQRRS